MISKPPSRNNRGNTGSRPPRGAGDQGYTIGRGRGPIGDEFESRVVDIARVTRVMAGGKRMRFRALVVVGNHKGRVGAAIAKGLDVAAAVAKATTRAKKDLITVPLREGTIPHVVRGKIKASDVLLRPAPRGTGVKAGSVVRIVLSVAGVENISAKMLGSKNKISNVRATLAALSNFRRV